MDSSAKRPLIHTQITTGVVLGTILTWFAGRLLGLPRKQASVVGLLIGTLALCLS